MLKKKLTPEELQKAREEAERKARRGEIEPTHDFTFNLISQFTGLTKVRKGLLFVLYLLFPILACHIGIHLRGPYHP